MSVPMQTFLSELQTALLTTGVSVKLRRNMVMDKVRSSATRHIIIVPANDVVTKPESTVSYIVTCSATVRLCVVDNTDADAITALTGLWSSVRQATYGKVWSGRKYVAPETDGEFTPDPETSNLYYMDVTFFAEYQEALVPITVPDVVGSTEAVANTAITAANFVPDSDGAFSSTVAKGIVISQSPAAGTAAYVGDVVTITVSFGVEYTVVPVVAGLTEAAAAAALVAAGLVVGTSTSEMTNDTAAGLVSASNPAAGTGVVAGSTVDLTVSLGDRHYEIPVYQCWGDGTANNLRVRPITAFDWVHPDGTVQNGDTCTYIPTRGAGFEIVKIKMKAGYTVADLNQLVYGEVAKCYYKTEDFVHCRPSSFYQVFGLIGDLDNLKDLVGSCDSFYINGQYMSDRLYGSINNWVPMKSLVIYIYQVLAGYGSLKFIANAPTSELRFNNSTGFSYADIAQTIINWDNCNAASFARKGVFDQYKRSLIGAANPAAEAAIVSLIAKGCDFTFLAE